MPPVARISQVVLVAAIVAATGGGVFLVVRASTSNAPIQIHMPTPTPPRSTQLNVYISGAVKNPGVFIAVEGDRLAQVLERAGGATDDADLGAVNLAARVRDEDHWHIPRIGEAPSSPTQSRREASPARLNINTASVEALKTLPNIGDVRAKAIVSYREANGAFERVDDLIKVNGVGPATLAAIRDLIEAR